MIIEVKENKAKCPECGKWRDVTFHDIRKQKELKCCKNYALLEVKNVKNQKIQKK